MAKKTVLIIDESELFREYLGGRIAAFGVEVVTAYNALDGLSKMRTYLPDLLILDQHISKKTCVEVLSEKNRNPNTASIPVLLTAQKIDKNRLLELVPYNIKKVFTKPIKIDSLYATLSETLGIRFTMDETPCIIEAHVNDNIVFIEIAKGLNREKMDLLKFKLAELLDLYSIRSPRVLLMISDMDLSFVDGPNLEVLLRVICNHSKAKTKHIKVLTNAAFVRDFVRGRAEFSDIEVLSNLQYAIDGLLVDYKPGAESEERTADLLSEHFLSAHVPASGGESIEMRFDADGRKKHSMETMREAGSGLSIAVVDDDFVIQELVKTTFAAISAKVTAFSSGQEFLEVAKSRAFDLVFLDIIMPGLDGFQVLQRLHDQEIDLQVIVLSAISQREAVVRAFQAGVKSYLIKPLKPDQILRKTLEILKANF